MTKKWFAAVPLMMLAVGALSAQGRGAAPVDPRPMGVKPADLTIKTSDPVIQKIWDEGMTHSMVPTLMQTLSDSIGPRLTGSPNHKAGNAWLIGLYKSWGITATNETWGQWNEWSRGVTHIDLIEPRIRSLEGTILGYSPGTGGKTVKGDVITLPDSIIDSVSFAKWLPSVKGKFVATGFAQPTCRPNNAYMLLTTPELYQVLNTDRTAARNAFNQNAARAKLRGKALQRALEANGAAGILTNNWSSDYGVDKIFDAPALTKIPVMDLSCEDYGLVVRLAQHHQGPKLAVMAESHSNGIKPVYNTVAKIVGSEKPNEYVVLSGHFDSWDGSSGSTDNGTGTVTMLEAVRLLKMAYPTPKRTILVVNWGGEEEGDLGSHGFATDHPEIVKGLQALWNQDNGTGRVASVGGAGLAESPKFFDKWLAIVPPEARRFTTFTTPGRNGDGSTDSDAFICAGAPSFDMNSVGYDYNNITWHTNRDTYDKVNLQEVQYNAVLVAMFAYASANDAETISHALAPGINARTCPNNTTRNYKDYVDPPPRPAPAGRGGH